MCTCACWHLCGGELEAANLIVMWETETRREKNAEELFLFLSW